jgi:hypothetical protein
LSFAQYLVARKSDSVIATLAKTIYSSRLALAAAAPGEIKIEAPSTDKDADAVVHPGALAYPTTVSNRSWTNMATQSSTAY